MSEAAFLAKAEKAVPRELHSTIAQDLVMSSHSVRLNCNQKKRAWNDPGASLDIFCLKCLVTLFPLRFCCSIGDHPWFQAINIHQPPKNRLTRDASLGSWLLSGSVGKYVWSHRVEWCGMVIMVRKKLSVFPPIWFISTSINLSIFYMVPTWFSRPFWISAMACNGLIWSMDILRESYGWRSAGPWLQLVPAGSKTVLQPLGGVLALGLQLLPKAGNPGTQCHPHHIRRTTSGSLSPSSQGIPGSFDTTFFGSALLAVNPRPLPGAVLCHSLREGHAACALFPVLVAALAHGLAIRHQGERLGVWPRRFRTSKSGSAPLTSAGKQHRNNRYPLVIKRGWLENPLSSMILMIFPLNPP